MINRVPCSASTLRPWRPWRERNRGMNVYVRDLTQELSAGESRWTFTLVPEPGDPDSAFGRGMGGLSRSGRAGTTLQKNLLFNHLAEFEAGVERRPRPSGLNTTYLRPLLALPAWWPIRWPGVGHSICRCFTPCEMRKPGGSNPAEPNRINGSIARQVCAL